MRGSSIEEDDGNRFAFSRSITFNALTVENRMSEEELRSLDVVATRNDHDKAVAN